MPAAASHAEKCLKSHTAYQKMTEDLHMNSNQMMCISLEMYFITQVNLLLHTFSEIRVFFVKEWYMLSSLVYSIPSFWNQKS